MTRTPADQACVDAAKRGLTVTEAMKVETCETEADLAYFAAGHKVHGTMTREIEALIATHRCALQIAKGSRRP